MAEKQTKFQFLQDNFTRYIPSAKESIIRNKHMNQLKADDLITTEQIDAVLTDFMIYISENITITTLPDRVIDLLKELTSLAQLYVNKAIQSILTNNKKGVTRINQSQVEAVVVDFINYIGGSCWIDYGLYTKDL